MKKQTIEIGIKLNLLPIEPGDMLILKGVFGEEEMGAIFDALVAKYKRDGTEMPMVVALGEQQTIETADEEAMKSAGWQRIPEDN